MAQSLFKLNQVVKRFADSQIHEQPLKNRAKTKKSDNMVLIDLILAIMGGFALGSSPEFGG